MKKKIKDPEKQIERLVNKVERLDAQLSMARSEVQKLRGNVIISWDPHEKEQTCAGSYGLGHFVPGERVMIIGKIIRSFAEIDEKCGNKRSGITYKVLETRRIGE